MTREAGREVATWLGEAEAQLARPESPASIQAAVEKLEQACSLWPALMACMTDRAVWESLALQIRRLERLANEGAGTFRVAEEIGRSAGGYTGDGEPARVALRPASVDCRG